MVTSFSENLRQRLINGSLLIKLIYTNVAVFLLIRLFVVICYFGSLNSLSVLQWIEVPPTWHELLYRPWTLLTYQFSHVGLMHIFFNMLWLYWLGKIFLDYFTPKQLTALYLLGGVAGGLLFVFTQQLLPTETSLGLIGASASILSIVVAIAVYNPDYRINLLFIGDIALKWIVAAIILLDLLSIDDGNAGGHIAHIGGALMGLTWGISIKNGHDLTGWLNHFIDAIVSLLKSKSSSKRTDRKNNPYNYSASDSSFSSDNSREQRLDSILDKIKKSGYSALTEEEKAILFSFSRNK